MLRPIAIGLSPNLEVDDVWLAGKNIILGRIFQNQGQDLSKLKKWFRFNLGAKNVFLFNSGRSALFLALKVLNLKPHDEVIMQIFTCVAVPNAVVWAGGKPVFVDIQKENLGIDFNQLVRKINNKTKAIIIQSTFGLTTKIKQILDLARKYKLVVIEDCAHLIEPNKIKKDKNLPDFSIYSFGRDKAVSSVFGGVLTVNNKHYLNKVKKHYQQLVYPNRLWTLQQHLHPLLMSIILPLYNFFNLGKFLLFLFQRISLLSLPVYQEEKITQKPSVFPCKMPASLACLALNQLKKINRFNQKRKDYVLKYSQIFPHNPIKIDNQPLLRYPLLLGERDNFLKKAKQKGFILGCWYSNLIDPKGVNLAKFDIDTSLYPTAKYVAQHIVNLPTYPTLSQQDFLKLLAFLRQENLVIKK